MTCVLVGFSRSLLALIHSLTSWTQARSCERLYTYIADWNAGVNLAVVVILVDVQTMTQDQLFKLSSVHEVQQQPQYAMDFVSRNPEINVWII